MYGDPIMRAVNCIYRLLACRADTAIVHGSDAFSFGITRRTRGALARPGASSRVLILLAARAGNLVSSEWRVNGSRELIGCRERIERKVRVSRRLFRDAKRE